MSDGLSKYLSGMFASIAKLNGDSDYRSWKFAISMVYRSYGVWEFSTDESKGAERKKAEGVRNGQEILTSIGLTMEPSRRMRTNVDRPVQEYIDEVIRIAGLLRSLGMKSEDAEVMETEFDIMY
jgi:hypothetical protein